MFDVFRCVKSVLGKASFGLSLDSGARDSYERNVVSGVSVFSDYSSMPELGIEVHSCDMRGLIEHMFPNNRVNLLPRNKLTLFDVFGLISDGFRNPSNAETSQSHDLFLDTEMALL